MSQPHDFPFDITDVAELLHLRIRRPSPQGLYVDCPICNDKRGKMHINTQTDTWRCNYCDESGGMLALYAKVHSISTSTAYREISDALLNGVNLSDHAVKYPDKPKETPVEAAPAADIAVRNKTYTALLAMLTLSKEHRAHLQTVRGLPDEQIERLGYKTMPPFYMCRSLANRLLQNGHQLDGVPGFYQKDGQWTIASSSFTAGIMIPARTRQGLTAMLHCKHGSVYDVVCFGIFLTHDLGCQFFDRQSRFHAHSLLSVAVSCITKKAGCRHL